MTWCLYRHTSPSGKVYIGITSNIKVRWSNNGYRYTTYNSIFKHAILKYGWDNIKHEILFDNLTKEEACKLEQKLIKHYKDLNISYNITDGGEGALGRKHSQETIQKIRNSSKGWSKASIEASVNSPKRRSTSLSNLEKAHQKWIGQQHSEKTKQKIREKAKGRDMTVPNKVSCQKRSVKVIMYNDTSEILFNSLSEAACYIGSNPANISRAIKNNYKVKQFNFKYYVQPRIQ